MLFTVVESRDARLVAESEDRKVKMTLEGADLLRFPVGGLIQLDPPAPVAVVSAPPVNPFATDKSAFVAGDEMPRIVTIAGTDPVVTTDLSDEAVAPLAKKAKRK